MIKTKKNFTMSVVQSVARRITYKVIFVAKMTIICKKIFPFLWMVFFKHLLAHIMVPFGPRPYENSL